MNKKQESATLTVTPDTLEQLAAVGKLFGVASLDATLTAVVDRFHAAHLAASPALPDGWVLRDDLNFGDMERYYEAYDVEKPVSSWHRHGRTIRSAVEAGWFASPAGLTADDVAALKPAQVPGIAAAIDNLYMRMVTDDPNS